MPDIVIVGLNHKTAPVEIRECLAFSDTETDTALEELRKHPTVGEVLLVSTCNRVEVLATTETISAAIEAVKTFLSDFKKVSTEKFTPCLYIHTGDEAVRHIFRVAASLDSMMVGEPQILGQIKAAYQDATRKKTSGVVLNRLMHRTFFVAKRVRTETGIGDHAVSISYAAVELGRKIFGSLQDKKVLLIGAGEMAELAVDHLIHNRAGDIFVANRTFERGVALAQQFHGRPIRFEEIPAHLQQVDIIISSTGSPGFIIGPQHVKGIMRGRRNRPLFFIDIAVPRDIDPETNRLPNVYVYDIDDLKGVIEENIQDRSREALKAERIIAEAVIRFRQWLESLSVVPTIVALQKKTDGIAAAELHKTLHALTHLSEYDREVIGRMTHAVIHKILHDPIMWLKHAGNDHERAVLLDITRKLFKLDD